MQEASSLKHETGRQENKPEIHVIQFFSVQGGGQAIMDFFLLLNWNLVQLMPVSLFAKLQGRYRETKPHGNKYYYLVCTLKLIVLN